MTGVRGVVKKKSKYKNFLAQEWNGELVVWEEIISASSIEEAQKLALKRVNITVKPQKD